MKKEKNNTIWFIVVSVEAIIIFILLLIISGGVNFNRSKDNKENVEYSEDSTTVTTGEKSNEAATAEAVDTTAITSEEKNGAEQQKPSNQLIIVEEDVTAENFLNYEENLLQNKSEVYSEYNYSGFLFTRSESRVTVTDSENNWKQLFHGSDFIVTDKNLWFINEDRNICMFEYKDFKYPSKSKKFSSSSYDYSVSEQYHEYGNADLREEDLDRVTTWVERYQDFSEVEGVTAIRTYAGTLLVDNTKINLYEKKEVLRGKNLPFALKEISKVNNSLKTKEITFKFVSSTNTVGIFKMSYIPFERYEIFAIAEGIESDRHLLHRTDENRISQIEIDENYAIYYEDGKLKGGNKNLHFYFDDLPWEIIMINHVYGVGKGIPEAQFTSDSLSFESMESKDIEKMLEETGINY